MAKIFARRLTYWLMGTPDDSPPPVPIPPEITPLRDHVAFFLNLRGRLPPEMTREEIMDSVNNAVSDRELQAHVMAYLRDYHGMKFDPKLNPNAPTPQYYSSAGRRPQPAGTVVTGKIPEPEPLKPHFLEPYFTSVPVGFDVPAEAPASPKGKVTAAPAAETVTAGEEKEAPAVAAAPAPAAETVTAGGEKEAPAVGAAPAPAAETVTAGGEKEAPAVAAAPAEAAEKTTAEEKSVQKKPGETPTES